MTEETETNTEETKEELDPLTAVNAEVDRLKKELDETKKKLDEANKVTSQVINTNKRLLATVTSQVGRSEQEHVPTNEEIALKSFYRTLGIEVK